MPPAPGLCGYQVVVCKPLDEKKTNESYHCLAILPLRCLITTAYRALLCESIADDTSDDAALNIFRTDSEQGQETN